MRLTTEQQIISRELKLLKDASGSHSPSLNTLKYKFPSLKIKVDACFLSNPYATDLFIKKLEFEILKTQKLREILEYYPSQNEIIAKDIALAINAKPENIFVGNGAIEIIQACMHNFAGQNTIVNIPTFSSYYEFVNPKSNVIFYKLKKENDYELDPKEYINFTKEKKPSSIIIINPNNPNGSYINFKDIRKIVEELREVEMILIDESFIHFAYEDEDKSQISTSELAIEFPNVVVVKSMSKDFGIAGVRAGYAIMSNERVSKLLKNGYLWNSSGLSEYFFKLYKDKSFLNEYSKVRIKYIDEAIKFFEKLKDFNSLRVYPTKANFALIELIDIGSSSDFVNEMLIKYGIYMRSCSDKIGLDGEFVRIACRTSRENKVIISGLNDYFIDK